MICARQTLILFVSILYIKKIHDFRLIFSILIVPLYKFDVSLLMSLKKDKNLYIYIYIYIYILQNLYISYIVFLVIYICYFVGIIEKDKYSSLSYKNAEYLLSILIILIKIKINSIKLMFVIYT